MEIEPVKFGYGPWHALKNLSGNRVETFCGQQRSVNWMVDTSETVTCDDCRRETPGLDPESALLLARVPESWRAAPHSSQGNRRGISVGHRRERDSALPMASLGLSLHGVIHDVYLLASSGNSVVASVSELGSTSSGSLGCFEAGVETMKPRHKTKMRTCVNCNREYHAFPRRGSNGGVSYVGTCPHCNLFDGSRDGMRGHIEVHDHEEHASKPKTGRYV